MGVALAAGAIAAPIIGGMMGASASQKDRDAAQAAYYQAYHQYDNVDIPDIQKQQLALQSPQVQGILQPYQQNAVQQGSSAMGGIQTDPRLQQAQMNALDTMSKMGQQGLTATDVAALDASRRQTAGDNQSRQTSILQQLAQRGASGGGLELATKLAASQGEADQAGQASDRTMAMAQQRMLQGAAQAGQLGGQMQAQQFGQQAQQAQAADAISRFNAMQKAQAQASNVGALNQAQASNLANAQQIANMGVATANTEQQYNKNLLQQQFGNQMSLASARAGQGVNYGNAMNQQGNAIAAQYAGMGAGAGQGLAGAYTAYNNGQNQDAMLAAYNARTNAMAPQTQSQTVSTPESSYYGPTSSDTMSSGSGGGSYMTEFKSDGGFISGEAPMPGDHKDNDIVDAKLSPGEIVIPRSHAISKDLAKAYIDHLYKVSQGKA